MGMAASQARLLTLTSRLHDVEFKAQQIQSQKIALATQKDELYQDYCDALDAKKIQVRFNEGVTTKYVDACFANLFGYNPERTQTSYALKEAKSGKLIVDDDTAKAYEKYSNDKYIFAWAMLGLVTNHSWHISGSTENRQDMSYTLGIGTAQANYGYGRDLFMTDAEKAVYEKYTESNTNSHLEKLFTNLEEICASPDSSLGDKRSALNAFREELYSEEIFPTIVKAMCLDKNVTQDVNGLDSENPEYNVNPSEISMEEFNYWVYVFESIQNAGGCKVIEPGYENGEQGNDWLNSMVSSGRVLIEVYNKNKKEWVSTNVATSTSGNHLQEVSDDTDLKKAEAEYEYELGIINAKDTEYDNDLSKLETERTAITTEMESIGKVRDENIERTFGIFS